MHNADAIERINKRRIAVENSSDYNYGRRVAYLKGLLKHLKIVTAIKVIIRHFRVSRYSYISKKYYQIDHQNDAWQNKKVVVYTCVTGNYDKISDPLFSDNAVDYVLLSDNDKNNYTGSWKQLSVSNYVNDQLTNSDKNRFIKMHPHELFCGQYDYAIYIDGNIQVVSDIRTMIDGIDKEYGLAMHLHRERNDIYDEYKVCKILKKGNPKMMRSQITRYKKDGLPRKYGMLEANVIVIDLHSDNAKMIMDEWWEEYRKSESKRDQIALPYVLWKEKIPIKKLANLGSNVYENSKFMINKHRVEDVL